MKRIKKHIGAILFITTILGINTYLWVTRMQAAFLNFDTIQTSVLGATLLMGFFLVFLLSTRMKWVVKIFGGLEELYFWHRILAMGTTALIFLHGFLAIGNLSSYQTSIFLIGNAGSAGELARNGFLFFVGLALLAKFFKYEHFRLIHRLLVIPYAISLYHSFYSSWVNLFSLDALSIWMIGTSLIGLGSSLYMIFVYQKTAFRFKGEIVDKIQLTDSVVELKVKLQKKYKFKAGQFAFIKVLNDNIESHPHPFSISGNDDEYIYFTIKNLGDFTEALQTKLEIPSKIRITRPFGKLTLKKSKEKQIWIAGGIGITPFLGMLRNQQELQEDIHLYYSVNYDYEAIHLDSLQEMSNTRDRFKFTLFEASKEGYLTADHLDIDDNTTVYMCGPRPMVLSLTKQLKDKHPDIDIRYEAFSFTGTLVEDALKTYKRIIRKMRLSH